MAEGSKVATLYVLWVQPIDGRVVAYLKVHLPLLDSRKQGTRHMSRHSFASKLELKVIPWADVLHNVRDSFRRQDVQEVGGHDSSVEYFLEGWMKLLLINCQPQRCSNALLAKLTLSRRRGQMKGTVPSIRLHP